MDKVFIYWDDSNIFISAQQVAIEREGEAVRSRVRIHFRNLLELARAGREIEHAVAVGSIPPELRHVWESLGKRRRHRSLAGTRCHAGAGTGSGPSFAKPRCCAMDSITTESRALRYCSPGTGLALTMASAFHADLERMRRRGWRIEVVSWRHSCNRRMREWAEENGQFIALDDFYDSVTFLERPAPGEPIAPPRYAVPVDLNRR